MGVKSTECITRRQAEDRFKDMVLRLYGNDWASALSDNELEDQLEFIDDKLCGGESFRNYLIVPEGQEDK